MTGIRVTYVGGFVECEFRVLFCCLKHVLSCLNKDDYVLKQGKRGSVSILYYSDRYTSLCIISLVTQWNIRCIIRKINGDFRA